MIKQQIFQDLVTILEKVRHLHDEVISVCVLCRGGKEQFRYQRHTVLVLAAVALGLYNPAAESDSGTVVLLEDRAQDLDIHRGAYTAILQQIMQ